MNDGLTITREVVTRDEAGFILGITETEFTTWLEAGTDKVPQMPNLGGKPTRFHLPTLRKWWLTYFQKGGEA